MDNMRHFLFYFFLFNSLALQAAEPPKLILQTMPQAAKTLALPASVAPTEVTTSRLEFNGYVAPKELTTNRLEFNGYVAPKEVTTDRLEFNGYVAPKELTTSRLEFNGKSVFSLPKTELLKPATIKSMVLNPPTVPPTNAPAPLSLPMPTAQAPVPSIPAQAQIPVTDNVNIIKQLPAEIAPVAPKNKPLLLKPIIVNPQNQ